MAGFVRDLVDENCPGCWTEGCGLDPVWGACADGLECITPGVETFASVIWCLGSPLAFPIIFCFSSDPHTKESSGWKISMLEAPYRMPCCCCYSTICVPCGQWTARYHVLGGDMSKYKLWQGYHDGPHCCARFCPGAPITIEAGTYGEQDCPHVFLCLEVSVLGGVWSSCCAFDVTRNYIRNEVYSHLDLDPTEARFHNCQEAFGQALHHVAQVACCLSCCGCCLTICATESEDAQELGGAASRAGRACWSIARTIWRGMASTRVIAMGCMTAQMIKEMKDDDHDRGNAKMDRGIQMADAKAAPGSNEMDRYQGTRLGEYQ